MYYNDYNRPHDEDERPIPVHGYVVGGNAVVTEKKKGRAAKIIALCLVCALLGGFAGGAGVYWFWGGTGGSTTMYESGRAPTVVNMVSVDGRTTLTIPEIYATNVGSVVGINGSVRTNYWGNIVSNPVAGSGFVITGDGYILTNYHVISGVEDIKASFADGVVYNAVLVGGEEASDIAVLKIDATGLTPVVVGSSDDLKVGEQVVAIGNPLGELTFTLTEGVVSALDRDITMSDGAVHNMLQTNAAINSGNSGGPLFNIYGELIGITSAKYSNNGDSSSASIEGIGFAIPIDNVKGMVTDIIEHGYVTGRPFLGIALEDVPSSARQYGVPAGAHISLVTPGLAADKAGLLEGDIVTALDGTAVSSSSALIAAVKDYKAGQTVTFTIYREGKNLDIEITLDEKTTENLQAYTDYVNQQQQQQQQQQSGGNSFVWPFGPSIR